VGIRGHIHSFCTHRAIVLNRFKHTSDTQKRDELRRTQVIQLQQEVKSLNDDLLQELALDRTQIVQLKSQVAEGNLEIANEVRHIKRVVALLFERQSYGN